MRVDDPELTVSPERRQDVLIELVDQNDQKHAQAHQRLRKDLDQVEVGLEALRNALVEVRNEVKAHKQDLTDLSVKPIDATNLVMTPKIVASIVFVVIGIAGSIWASTAGLRGGIQNIETRIELQSKVEEEKAKVEEANRKLSDERLNALRDAMQDMRRRQELQQYELQGMKETILKQGVGRR